MSIANSALTKLAFVPETSFGVVPTNPAFKRLPHSSCNLGTTVAQIEDDTIIAERHVLDIRAGNQQVAGDIVGNLFYGAADDLFSAAFCNDWSSNVLVPGAVRKSFSIHRHFTNLSGGDNPHHVHRGCIVDSLALEFKQEAFVKLTLGLKGRDTTFASAAPSGSTFADAAVKQAFTSFSGSLSLNSTPSASVTEMSLKITNGADPRFNLFEDKTSLHKVAKYRAEGSLTLYFESSALLTAYIGGVDTALDLTIVDPLGNEYAFAMPRVRLQGGQADTAGENDVMITLPFKALLDETAGYALQLTRTPA